MGFSKKPVKGMTDFLPTDVRLRDSVLNEIKRTYAQYGFAQIETPCMEHIGNLTSKQGGDNEKLIFRIEKRGAAFDRAWESGNRDELVDNGLRYDLTVPLARFYANNKEQLPSPFRALQVGPVWRADQPAKGRFRQFVQCDIDVLGDATNLAEIELITATSTALSRVLGKAGINNFTVHVNDRRILRAAALKAGFAEEELGEALRMDAGVMRELEARFGPVDWRVPWASSLYWGWLGAADAAAAGRDELPCRRMVYQSLMAMARGGGRLAAPPDGEDWSFDGTALPNPALAPGAIAYAEDCMAASDFSGIRFAYVYFLRDMVGLALLEGREADARAYYARLAGFFDGFGLAGAMPAFEALPATDPEVFTDLLERTGLR